MDQRNKTVDSTDPSTKLYIVNDLLLLETQVGINFENVISQKQKKNDYDLN